MNFSHVKPYESGRRRSEPVTGGDTKCSTLKGAASRTIGAVFTCATRRRECAANANAVGVPSTCIEWVSLCM